MKQAVIFLFTIIMLFLPCWVMAQKEIAHGVVKDSAGEPIELGGSILYKRRIGW